VVVLEEQEKGEGIYSNHLLLPSPLSTSSIATKTITLGYYTLSNSNAISIAGNFSD
jgi:hypothetical protein